MEKTFPIHGLDSVCVGIKITSIPGLNEPCSHLPVKISPVPLMLKQPFNGTLNGLSVGLGGISTYFSKVSTMVTQVTLTPLLVRTSHPFHHGILSVTLVKFSPRYPEYGIIGTEVSTIFFWPSDSCQDIFKFISCFFEFFLGPFA